MLIAHAPAGYLLTRILSRTLFRNNVAPDRTDRFYRLLMFAGILGGILPDFDFIYHIFIDSDRTPHHSYITHMPLFWIGLWLVLLAFGRLRNHSGFSIVSTILCCSALLHLVLDTLTGTIYWLFPFSMKEINIFDVADVHVWWVSNYVLHWTFLIEISITMTAMILFLRVKESVAYLINHFRRHASLRAVVLRFTVCSLGIAAIVAMGMVRFSIHDRIVHKVKQLRLYTVTKAILS